MKGHLQGQKTACKVRHLSLKLFSNFKSSKKSLASQELADYSAISEFKILPSLKAAVRVCCRWELLSPDESANLIVIARGLVLY